jgi:hypothetical protein
MNRQSLKRKVQPNTEQPPKKNKFGAKKQTINGIVFDSKAEAEFYLYLLSRQQNGEIQSFERQVTYTLLDRFKKAGKTYRPIEYIADFVVTNTNGSVDVVDVKGTKTREFQIKRKLFEARYPDLHLTIATKERGAWRLK